MEKLIELTDVERGIIRRFEKELERKNRVIEPMPSRCIFEDARADLIERARCRGDWEFVKMLHNPLPNSRATYAIEAYMMTLYEEMHD